MSGSTPDPAPDPAAVVAGAVAAADVDDPRSRAAAVAAVGPEVVGSLLRPGGGAGEGRLLAVGTGASPGTATGRAFLDVERAVDAAEAGEPALLVARETSPADDWALAVVAGVVTTTGGVASHAAVVARGRGLPAVCGAPLVLGDGLIRGPDGVEVPEGAVLSIDGATGEVRVGAADVVAAAPPPALGVLLGWADEVRRATPSPTAGRVVAVLANADGAPAAGRAVEQGAEGIGLCRTEHQLAAAAPGLLAALLVADEHAPPGLLDDLGAAQRDATRALLDEVGDLPVTVRLLDPPRHELLPPIEDLAVAEARGLLDAEQRAVLARRRRTDERNPMLGVRGARLARAHAPLYRVQAAAVAEAVREVVGRGGRPDVRLLVPLVISAPELAAVAELVDGAVASVLGPGPDGRRLPVGAMVETPRAALVADELAVEADFLSVGTNDLTQLVLGLSRDDVAPLVADYVERGLLDDDPFAHLDAAVADLVGSAVAAARHVRADLPVGACGEHAGDPTSIAALVAAGIDSVSCGPARVPVARLAVARALLGAT